MAMKNVVYTTKEDAEQVLEAMRDLLNQYEQVTVADFLELSGIASKFSDNQIGWTDLADVSIKKDKGYILQLPQAQTL